MYQQSVEMIISGMKRIMTISLMMSGLSDGVVDTCCWGAELKN